MVGAAMILEIAEEVATALRERRPVVALETSVVAQGLPPPTNLEAARRCAAAVRAGGAVPAAVAVIEGSIKVGEHRFEDAGQIGGALRMHWDVVGSQSGVLVAVLPPSPLPRAEVEVALAGAMREATRRHLPGKDVTPFLLAALAEATGNRSTAANIELLENNARVAAEIAGAMRVSDAAGL